METRVDGPWQGAGESFGFQEELLKRGRDLLQRTFSFSDAHAVANGIFVAHGAIVPASGLLDRCLPLGDRARRESSEIAPSCTRSDDVTELTVLAQGQAVSTGVKAQGPLKSGHYP